MNATYTKPAPVVEASEHTEIGSVLLKAADILRRDGWTQFIGFSPFSGKRCLVGAVRFAVTGSDTWSYCPKESELKARVAEYDVFMACCNHLRSLLGERVADWNDAHGRTESEVLQLATLAADLADLP